MFTIVIPIATAIPVPRSLTCIDGSIWATARMTAPFRTRTPSPSVSTVNGSATRMRSGQTSALTRPIAAAARSAVPSPSISKPGRIAFIRCSAAAVSSQTTMTLKTVDNPPARPADLPPAVIGGS